jgi:hypothetical protein
MTADLDSLQHPDDDSRKTNLQPAASSLDEPIDALVYDIHPAFVVRPEDIYRPTPRFSLATEPAKYKVPQRFGMSAILGIMTALALLFGGFRILNAEPVVYLFFGLLTLVICVVQMFNANSPRAASAIAGAVLAPFFAPPLFNFDFPFTLLERLIFTVALIFFGVPIGAFVGYLTGACAAGIFLVMDYWEPYLQGYSLDSHNTASPAT